MIMFTEILVLGLVGIFVIVILLIIWPKSGKMGIGLGKIKCPKCDNDLPVIRKPKNLRQMLWGGWTCPRCGCEVDKYGKEIHA